MKNHTEKRKKAPWILAILVLAVAIAAVLFLILFSTDKLQAYKVLDQFLSQPSYAVQLDAEITVENQAVPISVKMQKIPCGKTDVFCTQYGDFSLYWTDKAVILENGIGYPVNDFEESRPGDMNGMTDLLKKLKVSSEKDGKTTVYSCMTEGDEAEDLINGLIGGTAEKTKPLSSLALTMTAQQGHLQEITAEGCGDSCKVSVTVSVLPETLSEKDLPQAVRDTVKTGKLSGNSQVAEKFDDLLSGALHLFTADPLAASMQVHVSAGLLGFDTASTVGRQTVDGLTVTSLETMGYPLFFANGKACDTAGNPVDMTASEGTTSADELLQALRKVCLASEADLEESDGTLRFVFTANSSDLDDLIAALIPGSQLLSMEDPSGKITVNVTGEKITKITLAIDGELSLLLFSTPVSIRADLVPDDTGSLLLPTVSDAVLRTLR